MITQIVKSITGKDQFKEKDALTRTFLNAMKIQAHNKEAKLSSQSFKISCVRDWGTLLINRSKLSPRI